MSVDNATERETLERKDREELQKLVGALGGKATSRTRKADLIDQILELTGVTTSTASQEPAADESPEDDAAPEAVAEAPKASGDAAAPRPSRGDSRQQQLPQRPASKPAVEDAPKVRADASASADAADVAADNGSNGDPGDDDGDASGKRRRRRGRNRDNAQPEEFTGEPIPVVGCLDLRDDGYGFLRVDGLLPSKDDCYVSVKQVRQFALRKGDVITGGSRPAFRNEKNPAMLRIDTVNGVELEPGVERPLFEEIRATFPTERIALTLDDEPDDLTNRALDLLAPIGKGSRVLVLSPPRAGKTTMLQSIARAVEVNEPDIVLEVVLVDERPEEIAEMEGVVTNGTVFGAAFDSPAEDQVALVELALARARRRAEGGADVLVIVDGLTRLAKAAHAASQGVGRTLGGLDVAAIHTAKRCFGTGRNLHDTGSVTVIATAAVDTDSEADAVVADALVAAATTVVSLDGFAAARRCFPALDVSQTATRNEEELVGQDGAAQRESLRRVLAASATELPAAYGPDNTVLLDQLLARLRDTGSNEELLAAAAGQDKA